MQVCGRLDILLLKGGDVKSLVHLLEEVVHDCAALSGADLTRDVLTLRARVECEGDNFIGITLPAYCRDFERSLDLGRIGPGFFTSFKKTGRAGVPAFLQGLLSNVFDKNGILLAEPSTDCIRFVRQICLYGKKIERPCSKARMSDSVDGFVRCDDEIVTPEDTSFSRVFREVSRIIVGSLRLEGSNVALEPRHGPGMTRERIMGNQKYVHRRWHKRLLDSGFSWAQYGRFNPEVSPEEDVSPPVLVESGDEEPVRVVFVPKTQKTSRVIAVEPVCMQYAQQAHKQELVRALESSRYTRGHVNFRDQSVNQALALSSSVDGIYATLDMSEASDRVSLAHVELMLQDFPDILESWKSCRSERAELPDGRVISLKKFASMGSALCFPVESMVFFISIISSRLLKAGLFPTERSVLTAGRDVYVFGDDLIVPSDEAPDICFDLESFGFKVNTNKSFWTGRFRESCGTDVYAGVEVTPVYLRRDVPSDVKDVSALVSLVATAQQLYSAGYVRAFTSIKEEVEKILGPLPTVSKASAAIGWHHHSEVVPFRRWNRFLHRLEVNLWVPYSPKQADPLEGDAALVKCAKHIGSQVLEACSFWEWVERASAIALDHLEMSPRAYALKIKRRWVPEA